MKSITYYTYMKLWELTYSNSYSCFISLNGNEIAAQYNIKIAIKP